MVKLERNEKPEEWAEENVSRWTTNWQNRAIQGQQWSWPQLNQERINLVAKAAMLLWHHHKCAFCEKQDSGSLEIEHFASKQTYPSKAFQWTNLFLACGTCNKTKGQKEHGGCIKPDEDDPKDYLFVNPVTRKIEPRPDIPPEARERAKTTIKLYGLDRPELAIMYKYYWRNVAQDHIEVPQLQEITTNSADPWIGEYIRAHLPEVARRAQPTEEFSLMARSLVEYHSKLTYP